MDHDELRVLIAKLLIDEQAQIVIEDECAKVPLREGVRKARAERLAAQKAAADAREAARKAAVVMTPDAILSRVYTNGARLARLYGTSADDYHGWDKRRAYQFHLFEKYMHYSGHDPDVTTYRQFDRTIQRDLAFALDFMLRGPQGLEKMDKADVEKTSAWIASKGGARQIGARHFNDLRAQKEAEEARKREDERRGAAALAEQDRKIAEMRRAQAEAAKAEPEAARATATGRPNPPRTGELLPHIPAPDHTRH